MSIESSVGVQSKIRVYNRSPLIDGMQEITLLGTLSHAIDQIADCFDSCNRRAEPGSIASQQAKTCEEEYEEVDGHKTTISYTNNLAKNFTHSGLDFLKGATASVLDTGAALRWVPLALTRSLIESSAECLWVVDPSLDLETRLRRTNQLFLRDCVEFLEILPVSKQTMSRLLTIDSSARAECERAKAGALKWARVQGWKTSNGKAIRLRAWVSEIPSKKKLVALAGQGEPHSYWEDVYGMLSGVIHSQSLLMALAISDRPDSLLKRALYMLDIGISFFTHSLRQYADFMGWRDHDIDNWFGPVRATIQHLLSPQDVPLPVASVRSDLCQVCPDYKDPGMHRLALASHLCAVFERNIDIERAGGEEAPMRYSSAVELLDETSSIIQSGNDADPSIREMRTALGYGHTAPLSLLGSKMSDVYTSIAASWAVMSSSSYQSNVGSIQGWEMQSEDGSQTIPYGNT